MDTELLLRTIEELRGIHDITVTGGEPLLHPGFGRVLHHASRNASIVYLMTNGINLVGERYLRDLARGGDFSKLKNALKEALHTLPENLYLFFPLDSFHLKAFKPFRFLLKGLVELAEEWNTDPEKPFIRFLSNEISQQKSEELIDDFHAHLYTHIGTATFSPWRGARDMQRWYRAYPFNQAPFLGGLYINAQGVYLNEASLLLDLREGIETSLKIGTLNPANTSKDQLSDLYKKAQFR